MKISGEKKRAVLIQGGKDRECTCPLALRLGERTFCFLPFGTYRVGSREDTELPLKDFSVEGVHCEILSSPQGLKIVDRCGRTFLDGVPVEEVDLSAGMRLHLGNVPLDVLFRKEAQRPYLVRPDRAPSLGHRPRETGEDLGLALRRYQKALGPTFAEEIQGSLKAAPWFTLSVGAHIVLLFLLWNLPVFRGGPILSTPWTAWEPRLENQILPPGAHEEGPDRVEWLKENPSPDLLDLEPFLETKVSPRPLKDPGVYLGLSGGSFAEKVLRAGRERGKGSSGKRGATLSPRLAGTSPSFRRKVAALRRTGLDAVLVLDATASMAFGLHLVRSTLLDILYAQAALVPDNRTALVVFRDSRENPSPSLPTPVLPLAGEPWAAMDYLEILSSGGGGKPRESLLTPLERAFSLFPPETERRKVVLLFGDAPGHADEEERLRERVRRFHREEGGTLCMVYTGPPPEKSPFKGEALAEFRALARLGGGRCVILEDRRSMARDVLGLLLGEEDRRDMDKVLANLESRPPIAVRIARDKLRRSHPEWVLAHLASPRIPPGVVREALRRPDRALLAGLLALLEKKGQNPFPLQGRQAALYILKRTLPPFPLSPREIAGGYLEKKTLRALRNALNR